MALVLDLNKREEFLRDKNYVKKLKDIRRIVRTNGVSHNVRFLEINNKSNGILVWVYACFDENDNISGILAIDPVELIVGPSADLQDAKLHKYSSIEHAKILLSQVRSNIINKQQIQNHGR